MLEAQLGIAHRVEASRGDREHTLADIGTHDQSVRRGTGGQLGREEAQVPDPMSSTRSPGLTPSAAHRVALRDDVWCV